MEEYFNFRTKLLLLFAALDPKNGIQTGGQSDAGPLVNLLQANNVAVLVIKINSFNKISMHIICIMNDLYHWLSGRVLVSEGFGAWFDSP